MEINEVKCGVVAGGGVEEGGGGGGFGCRWLMAHQQGRGGGGGGGGGDDELQGREEETRTLRIRACRKRVMMMIMMALLLMMQTVMMLVILTMMMIRTVLMTLLMMTTMMMMMMMMMMMVMILLMVLFVMMTLLMMMMMTLLMMMLCKTVFTASATRAVEHFLEKGKPCTDRTGEVLHLLAFGGAKIEGEAAKRMLHAYMAEKGIAEDTGMTPRGVAENVVVDEMEALLRPPPVPGREDSTAVSGAALRSSEERTKKGTEGDPAGAVEDPSCQASTSAAKSGKKKQTSIRKWAENTAQKKLDLQWGRALCHSGVPFNFVRQDETKALHNLYMELGAQKAKTQMTSFEAIRTIVLDTLYDEVKQTVQPIMDKMAISGCTLITDGCTDRKFRPVLNFIAAGGGAVLVKVMDMSGRKETATALAKLWKEVIREIGVHKDTDEEVARQARLRKAPRGRILKGDEYDDTSSSEDDEDLIIWSGKENNAQPRSQPARLAKEKAQIDVDSEEEEEEESEYDQNVGDDPDFEDGDDGPPLTDARFIRKAQDRVADETVEDNVERAAERALAERDCAIVQQRIEEDNARRVAGPPFSRVSKAQDVQSALHREAADIQQQKREDVQQKEDARQQQHNIKSQQQEDGQQQQQQKRKDVQEQEDTQQQQHDIESQQQEDTRADVQQQHDNAQLYKQQRKQLQQYGQRHEQQPHQQRQQPHLHQQQQQQASQQLRQMQCPLPFTTLQDDLVQDNLEVTRVGRKRKPVDHAVAEPTVKRGRGRPRKDEVKPEVPAVKRGRGRPRKEQPRIIDDDPTTPEDDSDGMFGNKSDPDWH
ncbi:hypothetical protein CBR_g31775 [Chara braunii]|uniref:DUF659 domain-containing protein n=1 Tax=Chara braunii TaxID=69332 RepID=A0A388JYA3_CHABU|nr:hypothetical protein CBR_g31775 [Chara braunii]|eukprot:GBG62758.1 hypothetical protein CBR_g31775 [Chara braunii]